VDYPWAEQFGLQALGEVARAEGAAVESGGTLRAALAVLNERGSRWNLIRTIEALAGVAVDLGQPERAARLLGGADRLRDVVGEGVPPGLAERRARDVAAVRRRIGAERYAAAHAAGAALSDRDLIAEAGETEPAHTAQRPQQARVARSPITSRERRVAHLVAEGLGNREIAEELGITEATAESHLRHIFNKLGLNRRSQIAAWVARQESQQFPRPVQDSRDGGPPTRP
jgi:DNA-binding CsgD family transcriptional regulator